MNPLSKNNFVSAIAKSKKRFTWIAVGFFVIHCGMTFFSTYYFASKQNAVVFENRKHHIKEPTRWHNYLDLNRWDSAHYQKIAQEGYVRNYYDENEKPKVIIWYPGYPLIARGVQALTHLQMTAVFSLLSVLFTMTFWLLLWSAPLRDLLGIKSLLITSLFILCWPGSYYWFAGMTEPLIGLFLIGIIILYQKNKWNSLAGLLALATSVKQVFLALTLACSVIDLIKHKNNKRAVLGRFLLSCAGFIAFEIYSRVQFGHFFASANIGTAWFNKQVSFFSIINLTNYASNFGRYESQVAFFSMLFLLIVLTRSGSNWIKPIYNRSMDSICFLWWLALAYTTFSIVGNGAGQYPFASLLRFQTVNIPIILLISWNLRTIPTWRLIMLFTPIVYIMLYWQNHLIIRYWNWHWVS